MPRFVPATVDVWEMEVGKDAECKVFQNVIAQGRVQGMPNESWQGCYVIAPNGKLVAHCNVAEYHDGRPDVTRILELMDRALENWQGLSRKDRLLSSNPSKELGSVHRADRFYPADGLVLHEYARDLPHEHLAEYDREKHWKEVPASQWNQDFAWFTKVEARQFLPSRLEKGQKRQAPAPLVQRLACCHLFDWRIGRAFSEQELKEAWLTAEVTAVGRTTVSVRFEGKTRAVAMVKSPRDAASDRSGEMRIETRIQGKATYDRSKDRFIRFELVAIGTRQGNKEHYELFSPGPAPVGFLFTLAGKTSAERLAPLHFHLYRGWNK